MFVGEKNAKAIEFSDGILALLDGTDADSGTASETGCAFALVGCRGDFGLTGDNPGSPVNLQVKCFIQKSSGTIVCSIEELAGTLGDVFSG